jgi:hypothetical protein
MSDAYTIRVEVGKDLSDLLARSSDKAGIVKRLKRTVPKNAAPTLNAVKQNTPFHKGQLIASLGLTNKTNAKSGEVYTIVGVKDNISVTMGGQKTLFTSQKLKRAVKTAASKGIGQVSSATAFKYIRRIESGFTAKGKLGRRAGGAHMLERGAQSTGPRFTDQVGNDMLAYILQASEP